MVDSSFKKYLRSLKWTPLPVGVGLSLIAFQQYKYIQKREEYKLAKGYPCDCLADKWEVQFYKLLPLRHVSRIWGWCHGKELPQWSRNTILGSYVRSFGCNMAEAEVEDLTKYKCLSELFKRRLKPELRPIHPKATIVSPVDGTILSVGKVTCSTVEQVKGVTYSMKKFLGPNCWTINCPMVMESDSESCYHESCIYKPHKNDLFQVTIYLAPGDYHRFHSPTEWNVTFRRHYPGELLSVNPSIASWIRELFILNERVNYYGNYKHGFFSMVAVGATNVGSIVVPFDDDLKTNIKFHKYSLPCYDKYFEDENKVQKVKGEDFGEFNLGSTVVLIFEAPKSTRLDLEVGQRVKLGQPILNEVSKSTFAFLGL